MKRCGVISIVCSVGLLSSFHSPAHTQSADLVLCDRLASDPAQSFLMLELDDLPPAVARDDERAERARAWRQEELLDLGGGDYVERGSVDEEAIPDTARNVVRLFNGQVMLVTKGSIWNGASVTYSGVHDTETHSEVRKVIQ